MLLGAFSLLAGSVTPTRNLRFVWQRAEENPVTESGGAMLVREGACEDVTRVYGLHVDANRKSGWFLSRSGAHMANVTGLAAARHEVLRRAGWNVEEDGLQRAPKVRVIVGDEVHVSVVGALRMLGIGARELVRVPVDQQ